MTWLNFVAGRIMNTEHPAYGKMMVIEMVWLGKPKAAMYNLISFINIFARLEVIWKTKFHWKPKIVITL